MEVWIFLPPEQFVHERNHLQDELILAKVVSVLEDGLVLASLRGEEGQLAGHERRLEQTGFFRYYTLQMIYYCFSVPVKVKTN